MVILIGVNDALGCELLSTCARIHKTRVSLLSLAFYELTSCPQPMQRFPAHG